MPVEYSSLRLSHFYSHSASKSCETAQSSVTALKWSPDYRVLCVMYDRGHMSLFSVFGSLLYDSKDCLYFNCSSLEHNMVRLFEFGVHGYSLWIYMQSAASSSASSSSSSTAISTSASTGANTSGGAGNSNDPPLSPSSTSSPPASGQASSGELVKLKMLKSALIGNGYMSNVEHVALNGERECYVCLNLNKTVATAAAAAAATAAEAADEPLANGDAQKQNRNNNNNNGGRRRRLEPKYQYPSLKLGGNSIFQILNLPYAYISTNFPIKVSETLK